MTLNRVFNKLCPEKLEHPFVDPVTDELVKNAVNIRIYGKNHKRNKNSSSKISTRKKKSDDEG